MIVRKRDGGFGYAATDLAALRQRVGDLEYAHARVRSILARAGDHEPAVDTGVPVRPEERDLILDLDGFADTLTDVTAGFEPHRLCGYLYRLAQTFATFYEQCPVLRADPAVRGNRLTLCRLTGDTLRTGLSLLGIDAPDQL